jgi:hypothetical protein
MLASRPTSGAAANRSADKAEAAGQQEFDGVVQAVMAAAAQMAQPPESSASLRPPSPPVAPAEDDLPVEGSEAQLSLQQTASGAWGTFFSVFFLRRYPNLFGLSLPSSRG